MPGYDAGYDYGLRGRFPDRSPRGPADGPSRDAARERRAAPRGPRVTQRYNRDYVFGGRGGDAYPRDHTHYVGGGSGLVVGEGRYRMPYLSRGGTRTYRGMPEPIRYGDEFDRYDEHIRPFR